VWRLRDATCLPAGSLGADDAMGPDTPSPTVLLLFITGHGLCALSRWLKDEWEKAAKPFAIVTCVEALDACVDWYGAAASDDEKNADGGNPLFDAPANPNDWAVYRDSTHAKYGVFVTPPRGVSVDEWAKKKPQPRAADPASVTSSRVVVVRDVLDESDVAQIESLVERLEPGFFSNVERTTRERRRRRNTRRRRRSARRGAGSGASRRRRRRGVRRRRRNENEREEKTKPLVGGRRTRVTRTGRTESCTYTRVLGTTRRTLCRSTRRERARNS
jgi:hypothetical protein